MSIPRIHGTETRILFKSLRLRFRLFTQEMEEDSEFKGFLDNLQDKGTSIGWDRTLGRYLQASIDFKKGDLIFSEDALVYGPVKSPNFARFPPCLGCYRSVTNSYKCSKCHWPVCDEICSDNEEHALQECQLFAKSGITPEDCGNSESVFKWIFPLRCLLIKRRDSNRWESIANLQANLKTQPSAGNIRGILQKLNGLSEEVTLEDVFQVLGGIRINSFGTNESSGVNCPRFAAVLFKKASLMAHSCAPNSRWEIIPEFGGKPGVFRTFSIKVWASVDIPKGESISIQYMGILSGTEERRGHLKDNFQFDCDCKRCVDPTELGSKFSSPKCPKCQKGDLIFDAGKSMEDNKSGNSESPMKSDPTKWVCDICEEISEFPREMLSEFADARLEIGDEHNLENVMKLQLLLEQFSGSFLNPNHYFIYEIRDEIIKRIFTVLSFAKKADERLKGFPKTLAENSRFLLRIVDHFYPGVNRLRGRLICYLIYGQLWDQIEREEELEEGAKWEIERNIETIEGVLDSGNELFAFKPNFVRGFINCDISY